MLYLLYVLVKQDCYIHHEVCVMGEYPSLPNCEFHFSHCCLREKLQVIFNSFTRYLLLKFCEFFILSS